MLSAVLRLTPGFPSCLLVSLSSFSHLPHEEGTRRGGMKGGGIKEKRETGQANRKMVKNRITRQLTTNVKLSFVASSCRDSLAVSLSYPCLLGSFSLLARLSAPCQTACNNYLLHCRQCAFFSPSYPSVPSYPPLLLLLPLPLLPRRRRRRGRRRTACKGCPCPREGGDSRKRRRGRQSFVAGEASAAASSSRVCRGAREPAGRDMPW